MPNYQDAIMVLKIQKVSLQYATMCDETQVIKTWTWNILWFYENITVIKSIKYTNTLDTKQYKFLKSSNSIAKHKV